MAERGFTPVQTIPIFKNRSLSAGESGTSDSIDLRFAAQQGYFSLAFRTAAGTSTTCGTTVFSYAGSPQFDGVYVTPSNAAAIGTAGTAGTSNIVSFFPEPMPFMKIIATQTGAGTAGANTKITQADLIVQ